MIRTFRDKETSSLFLTGESRLFRSIQAQAVRRLAYLTFAKQLSDLLQPQSNRLEKLRGDRAGQYSIRINDQYRICFRWEENAAWDVEIVGYH